MMPTITGAFASFTVSDLEAARAFYADTVGLEVSDAMPGGGPLWLSAGGQPRALVYSKPDHQPAAFTILNLAVDDIEATVDDLAARGITFERYPEFDQDERGILHGRGHDIAWFNDPAGNNLCLVHLHGQPAAG
jgi:catechol 2,3-dioxygenase-like lactoylglutathione lyase family enzyme